MLALLGDRLGADPAAELRTAAGQQWEITILRLTRAWDDGLSQALAGP